jgi:hypothetical protein
VLTLAQSQTAQEPFGSLGEAWATKAQWNAPEPWRTDHWYFQTAVYTWHFHTTTNHKQSIALDTTYVFDERWLEGNGSWGSDCSPTRSASSRSTCTAGSSGGRSRITSRSTSRSPQACCTATRASTRTRSVQYHGFAPAIVPSVGYCWVRYCTEAVVLGGNAMMFMVGMTMPVTGAARIASHRASLARRRCPTRARASRIAGPSSCKHRSVSSSAERRAPAYVSQRGSRAHTDQDVAAILCRHEHRVVRRERRGGLRDAHRIEQRAIAADQQHRRRSRHASAIACDMRAPRSPSHCEYRRAPNAVAMPRHERRVALPSHHSSSRETMRARHAAWACARSWREGRGDAQSALRPDRSRKARLDAAGDRLLRENQERGRGTCHR